MGSNIYPGAIHWLGVTYEDEPHRIETRPVLILKVDGERVYYYQVTTQRGRQHQRKYRPSIINWRQSGLLKPSYIKIKNPPSIAYKSDFEANSYAGDITQQDADRMTRTMRRLGY